MRFAIADPPYLGCGAKHYAEHHADAADFDDLDTHAKLIARLVDEYPDGWALCLHEPSLRAILNLCPDDIRVGAWCKPFASFKANVTRAWAWEPVILRGGRAIPRDQPTVRDYIEAPAIAEGITLKRGLVGAKPRAVVSWILDWLNVQPGDTVDDLFPGTGAVGAEIARRLDQPAAPFGLFSAA